MLVGASLLWLTLLALSGNQNYLEPPKLVSVVAAAEDTRIYLPIILSSWAPPTTPICYRLTLTHNGLGSDPDTAPQKSAGCQENHTYFPAENITLSDAVPEPGWQISGWTGTLDDASTEATNLLVMPAGDYTAGVDYAYSPFAACAFRTGNNATVGVPENVAVTGIILAPGDEIAIFAGDGICAGKATWSGSGMIITAWGDDDQTPEKDGLTAGEAMDFRILDKSTNDVHTHVEVTFSLTTTGDGSYQPDGIYLVSEIGVISPAP